MTTTRVLVTVVVKRGWDIFQLDVNNAFLHGDLHDEVYMKAPPGLVFDQCSSRYQHSENDYSLFCKKSSSSIIFGAVYVDDVIITGTVSEEDCKFKGIPGSKRKFDLDLLKDQCFDYSSVSSPLDPAVKLKAQEGNLLPDPTYYRKLMGKLNFLTNTKLDIAYSVKLLSQFMQAPRDSHLTDAFHLLRYLKKDTTLGIFFSNILDCSITVYCDSDWAACPDSRRSITGYIVLVGDSPISWKSKKQETVSLSSAEAEYRSLKKAVGELVWLSRLFAELTVAQSSPIKVFCDSRPAIHIAHNPVFHERTKYIEVDVTL
ncbi:PREDICTED: uncharacterized protein LOC109239031 [Nicotiana attenuata]|uniref:uncharacterized protein LOC109239031 n=1 Tax=Nicotiana attenuata TaxID=49451 RepID=UPI00090563D7|nr:PREDICTED: uncharacterized protein LOC109239031 [Nicotiana attenuata]